MWSHNPCFLFSVLTSTSTLLEFAASSKHSSVLVCRSLYRTLSAHGTMRPGLLRPQNLRCACDDALHESYVSLEAMPFEASWVMYVEWSRAEVGRSLSPSCLYTHNIDSRL